jgi:hypothetical protein
MTGQLRNARPPMPFEHRKRNDQCAAVWLETRHARLLDLVGSDWGASIADPRRAKQHCRGDADKDPSYSMRHLPNIGPVPSTQRMTTSESTLVGAEVDRRSQPKGVRRARPNTSIGNIPGADPVSGTSICRPQLGPPYSLALVYSECPACKVQWGQRRSRRRRA